MTKPRAATYKPREKVAATLRTSASARAQPPAARQASLIGDEWSKPRQIHHKACDEFDPLALTAVPGSNLHGFSERLSWPHYRTLTKVEHDAALGVYEIEAERGGWNVPHLERQVHTQFFARLLKSNNPTGVLLELATRGHILDAAKYLTPLPSVEDLRRERQQAERRPRALAADNPRVQRPAGRKARKRATKPT
jgi:hypothetical protein